MIIHPNSLLYINASWIYNDWENIDKDKLLNMHPAELPTFDSRGICYNVGYQASLAVLKNAPNRDNAIKLMKYLTRSDVSEKWVGKSPTAIKGNLTSVNLGREQFENFEYTMNLKYGTHLLAAYDNRYILGIKNKDVKIPFIEILEKKLTASKAIQNFKRQIKP
jgi:ABC-type glycerol-3-phosphate transport system substrate-binding protein